MSRHDESRRAFLLGTVAGAGAAAAGNALVAEARAQDHGHDATSAVGNSSPHGRGLGAFLNLEEAAAVEAFAERLMPGAPGMSGAREAGVLNYIDLALAGAYTDLRDFYRRGLAALAEHCRAAHGKSFVELSPAQQDEVIKAIEDGKAESFIWPSARAFFNTLRTHTIEGMFADPVYGGNKDFAGWRLVGFPGAQPAFTPEDLQSKGPFTGATVIGLQAQAPARR